MYDLNKMSISLTEVSWKRVVIRVVSNPEFQKLYK